MSLAAVLLCLAMASGTAQSGEAAEDLPDDLARRAQARWIPAFSLFGGVLAEGADGEVATVERGDFDDDAIGVFAAIGASGEVSTPALVALPGGPRLFAHVDVSVSFDSTEFIVSEGSAGQVGPPDDPLRPNPPVATFKGQGSQTGAEAQPLVLSAGAGLAFGLQLFERQLRIKPSLEWIWHETRVRGQVGVAVPLIPPPPDAPGAAPCPCRSAGAATTRTQGWHSLGAGLELELDTARAGPFLMALYASGQAYRVLGDRKLEISGSSPWDDGSGTLDFQARYETEPWRYRLGVGLRFRWLPD